MDETDRILPYTPVRETLQPENESTGSFQRLMVFRKVQQGSGITCKGGVGWGRAVKGSKGSFSEEVILEGRPDGGKQQEQPVQRLWVGMMV